MDTKLKKFNLSALFKFIAVMLCLACVGGTACQFAKTWAYVEKYGLEGEHFHDAIFNTNSKNIWENRSFQREFNIYISSIASHIASYGDGSKKAYETMVDSFSKENKQTLERTMSNICAYVEQSGCFNNYIQLLKSGDIISCGFVLHSEGYSEEYNEEWTGDEYCYDTDYLYLSSGTDFNIQRNIISLPNEVEKLMDENNADGVVFLSSRFYLLVDSETKIYDPGYYLYKIDENTLKSHLTDEEVLKSIPYYDEFKEEYLQSEAYIKENFPSGKYYIKDVNGSTYTNIKALSKNSSEKEIKAAFSSLGFYTYSRDEYSMYLADGTQYIDSSFQGELEAEIFNEGSIHYYETTTMPVTDPTLQTTTIPETTTVPEPTSESSAMATTHVDSYEDATTYKFQVPTTISQYNGKSAFIVATENPSDMTVYIGVDMNSDAYKNMDCRFGQVQQDIYTAFSMTKGIVLICGTLGLIFLALSVFLIIKSGRRFGDKENVYMLPGDNIFTDWRVALDCLCGTVVFLVMFWIFEEFFLENAVNEIIILALGALTSALVFFVIDLVLFITRHIKNKTLLKRLFLVWLIKKYANKIGNTLKIKSIALKILITLLLPVNITAVVLPWALGWDAEEILLLSCPFAALYDIVTAFILSKEKKWTELIKEKMQYVRGFEKQTVIKGAVVLGVNLILGLLTVIEIVNTETLFFAFILVIFDIFVCIQLIRFIAGVKKIFSAVNELKEGNYDVQINLFSIPSSLHEPANKLMNLRDGLKNAVAEAVKQEQTKTELITNVSHDLKTPLTSVINYVDLLKKCDIKDETAQEYLSILGEKSDRLKKLIEDLVEASKASTGNIKLNIVEVSLNEILHQITGEFADEFERRGLNLISDIPEESIMVFTDSKSLYRVLENLMGNVVKYAMENTRVYLSLSRRGNINVITLKNISGSPLNISADELMERFVRADESRSSSGNGLGLSIAKSLCMVLGGNLEIEINGDLFVANVEI